VQTSRLQEVPITTLIVSPACDSFASVITAGQLAGREPPDEPVVQLACMPDLYPVLNSWAERTKEEQ
jgi:hypothetical protein